MSCWNLSRRQVQNSLNSRYNHIILFHSYICWYLIIFINITKNGNRRAILTDQNLGNKNPKFLWLDWKNTCDQTYSCLKRLPSLDIMMARLTASLNIPDITCTIVLRGIINWVPIMLRDARLSDRECKFFSGLVLWLLMYLRMYSAAMGDMFRCDITKQIMELQWRRIQLSLC